jgi:hypothetical protein
MWLLALEDDNIRKAVLVRQVPAAQIIEVAAKGGSRRSRGRAAANTFTSRVICEAAL